MHAQYPLERIVGHLYQVKSTLINHDIRLHPCHRSNPYRIRIPNMRREYEPNRSLYLQRRKSLLVAQQLANCWGGLGTLSSTCAIKPVAYNAC